MDPSPLLVVAKRRSYGHHPEGVVEREGEGGQRSGKLEEVFGTNPLPKLEKFVFKVWQGIVYVYMYMLIG